MTTQLHDTGGAATSAPKSASKPRVQRPERARRATVRQVEAEDGRRIWALAARIGALDDNSPYAYLMFCHFFGHTSLIVESVDDRGRASRIDGFVLALRPPRDPSTVFVWQVGVAPEARGQGLASRLLDELLALPACHDVEHLEATVTPGNEASRALFRGLARRRGVACEVTTGFPADWFPGDHEAEDRFRIGPFDEQAGPRSFPSPQLERTQ